MQWSVLSYKGQQFVEVVTRWHLDSPQAGTEVAESLRLAGWALAHEGQQDRLHFVVQRRDGTYSYRMNSERDDVASAELKTDPSITKGMMLGFNLQLERHQIESPLKLGFETDGLIQWVATLSIATE
jgi:hypothetical protein